MDDESKQLLRELLATQKEHLELVLGMDKAYEKQNAAYDESNRLYHETSRASTIANIIRALSLLGIVLILAYLVFFGMHSH